MKKSHKEIILLLILLEKVVKVSFVSFNFSFFIFEKHFYFIKYLFRIKKEKNVSYIEVFSLLFSPVE